jgi:non-specific serine/threonine protein kinase
LLPSDVLDLLTRLMDKSLVDKSLVVTDEAGGALRYRLLETIRQYAREKLADSDEGTPVRDRHLDYFVKLFDAAQPQLYRANPDVVRRMALEIDNVRAALDWSTETGRVDDGLRLAVASFGLWAYRGHRAEMLERLLALLAQPVPDPNTVMRAYGLAAVAETYYFHQGSFTEAEAAAQQALALGIALGHRASQAKAYPWLASAVAKRGDYALAHAYVEKLRELQDDAEVRAAAEREGSGIQARILQVEGFVWMLEGHYAQAQQAFAQAAAIAQLAGDINLSSANARGRGYALLLQGDLDAALHQFRESLVLNAAVEDRQAVAGCVAACGAVALARGDLRRAARLNGASEALSQSIHARLLAFDHEQFQHNVAVLRERLDAAALDAAWAEGRAMTMEQAMVYALEAGGADGPPVQ